MGRQIDSEQDRAALMISAMQVIAFSQMLLLTTCEASWAKTCSHQDMILCIMQGTSRAQMLNKVCIAEAIVAPRQRLENRTLRALRRRYGEL